MGTIFRVAALKNVDFPTFGLPTIPTSIVWSAQRGCYNHVLKVPCRMPRVLVAGGGAAGVAAAVEAATFGAEVRLLESSERLAPNRSLLPYLLSGRCSRDDIWSSDPDELSEKFDVEVSLGQRIRSVDAGAKSVQTSGLGGVSEHHP